MPSILNQVRALQPQRPLSPSEAISVAERQAIRLLSLSGITEPHVPGDIIAGLPRIRVGVRPSLPVAGSSHWSTAAKHWIITLNGDDVPVRQRFTLAHEFKHVIDHPVASYAYPATGRTSRAESCELICDYFAACLLMPRPWVKRVYGQGLHEVGALAALFGGLPGGHALPPGPARPGRLPTLADLLSSLDSDLESADTEHDRSISGGEGVERSVR